jgi:hypothetical protein
MHAVLQSYGRALMAQFHARMLLLSVLPLLLALGLWAALLWFWFQPLVDLLQQWFTQYSLFSTSTGWLSAIGLGALTVVVVPLCAMLLLLPLMVASALLVVGSVAMPAIVRHVGRREFASLARERGGSVFGSLWLALVSFLLFALLWLLTLPLYFVPPLAMLAQVGLWGWLTCRVMSYDALADYASTQERRALLQQHRAPLLAIGVVSGLAGAVPGMVWVGGVALSVALFPLLMAISIWLYVLIFIFTGLWFTYYCLQALAVLRAGTPLRDIN